MEVLLTGASGYLGGKLLAELLQEPNLQVHCLLRSRGKLNAKNRVERLVDESFRDRVHAVEGTLGSGRLGVSEAEHMRLAGRITHIIHSAANLDFSQGLDALRQSNVEGTREVLEFATACQAANPAFQTFSYVSTAYVQRAKAGAPYRNAYEQSKSEAEQMIRGTAEVPYSIFRPSIIWGDVHGQSSSRASLLDILVYLFSRWPFPFFPAGGARMDVVPVSYVAKGIVELTLRPPKTPLVPVMLVQGEERDVSARTIAQIMRAGLKRRAWIIPPLLYFVFIKPLLRLHPAYKPPQRTAWANYFYDKNPRFDGEPTIAALAERGIALSSSAEVIEANVRHSLRTA